MYQEYLNQLQATISTLSSYELKDLLNDEDKLDEKVDEVLQGLKMQKDRMLTENRTKAESNLEKEPQIIELRGKVNELLQDGKKQCELMQKKLAQNKEKSGSMSQETALALLQTTAAESEEASEVLVKNFTNNEINVDAFLEEFLNTRKTMHLRKLKSEKMLEIIKRQTPQVPPNRNSGIPSYTNIPSSSFFATPQPGQFGVGGSVPYPLGPMMPMPPPRPY